MILSLDKGMYTAVLLGDKTLTTRVRLPAHIAVGKEWAIVPKRARPAWWFDFRPMSQILHPVVVTNPRLFVAQTSGDYMVDTNAVNPTPARTVSGAASSSVLCWRNMRTLSKARV